MTPEQLTKLAEAVEAGANEEGWDQPSYAYFVIDNGDLMVVELPDPVGILSRLDPAPPEVIAMLVLIEGWSYPDHLLAQIEREETLRELCKRQPPRDHPQRVEVRNVLALSRDGHMVWVNRPNGGKPTVTATAATNVTGDMPSTMRRILNAR